MKHDFTIWRNQILQNPRDISPLKFGMSQDEVIEIFGNPDVVSTMRSDGKPLILKYHDIELHFDRKAPHGLYLVYSDNEIELSITDHHEELLQPITNIEPVDNEFFLRDGAVYFSGLYENGLLKGVSPKDFCCWHYWGKSSTACFLGGIRLRGADPASFRVLNYERGPDGKAVIVPEQAETVRFIYQRYLAGDTLRTIKAALEEKGCLTVTGKTEWTPARIQSILTNEKYCGDALLQKTFIQDCISKKVIQNTGQLPKYLIQNHHPAIISREEFDAVQLELARRRARTGGTRKSAPTGRCKYSGKYILSNLLFCGECGTA